MTETVLLQRILIVDDDLDATWAVATILRLEGCEVREAMDGARAVDEAIDMKPDAIVMDIAMPGIDGIEAASVLKGLFSSASMPRLVAMTGFDPAGHQKRILAAGFDRFLSKPVGLADLLAALRRRG